MCVLSGMFRLVIDDCMVFVNLNVKKMDIAIWKIIYCKFDVLIRGIYTFVYKFNMFLFH